jgi:hypothetical protein
MKPLGLPVPQRARPWPNHTSRVAHTGTHWHTALRRVVLGPLEDDVLTLPVSGTAHHKWKVGLLPSKVRLLSKVLLEATSLLASYVLVNTSSPPARGDGTEESRAES